MSPSNFHKMCTFLRVTNACHCLMMMTYTNIQRIAFLFHYFFHTKLIPKPPASAARLTRKLPTMCLAPRRPPEKRHLSGGCWLSPPPSQVIHIYIYRYIYIYCSCTCIYIYIFFFVCPCHMNCRRLMFRRKQVQAAAWVDAGVSGGQGARVF